MNNNLIGNIETVHTDNNIIIKSNKSIFYNSFYFQDFYDDKCVTSFIKGTERLIRQSQEYDDYLSLMKTNYNILTYDNILSHIGDVDATIEFHHYPFTLYEIVEAVMNHHFLHKENFTSFSLAKEIMELHFKQKIGFIPLSTTNHQLAHGEQLFISTKQVFGKWEEFAAMYDDGISVNKKNYIKKIKDLSDKNFATDYKGILNVSKKGV